DQDRQRYLDLYRTNPRRAMVVCDGDWGIAEGLVFDGCYKVLDFDLEEKKKDIGLTVHGMDFGFTNDPTTLPSAVIDQKNNELWVYEELDRKGLLIEDIIKEVEIRDLMKAEINADSASPQMIAKLKNRGVRRIKGANKGKDSIEHGIVFMQGLKIYIHPKCEKTLEEFNTYVYQQDKTGKWLNKPVDANNHIIDALRYALEPYMQSQNGWLYQ